MQQELQQLREQVQQMRQELNAMKAASGQAAVNSGKPAPTAPVATADMQTVPAAPASGETGGNEIESPLALRFHNITLVPGGFLAADGVYRSHADGADVASDFGMIPLGENVGSRLAEFQFSALQSRISLSASTTVHGMKTMGYFEMDFLANPYSMGYDVQPRLRLGFVNVDLPHGISVTGGQNWSLLQTNRKGIEPLSEAIPMTIDESYVVGYSNVRQAGFRVVKSIGDKAWAAFAAENPQTAGNGECAVIPDPSVPGAYPYCSFGLQSRAEVSVAPDLIAKLAFEPGWGHYEIKAIGRFFRDRAYPNYFGVTANTNANTTTFSTTNSANSANPSAAGAYNNTSAGAGLGIGMILPVVPNKVDITFQALGGRGIGRYGTTDGPDVTFRPDGSSVPVLGYHSVLGIETHPTPKFDLYFYGGDEYYQRAAYYDAVSPYGPVTEFDPNTGNFITVTPPIATGYGSPWFNNSGCDTELSNSPCMSGDQNRSVWEVTPGFWYRFWQGREGSLQLGASYSYVARKAWAGVGGTTGANENTVMTSFRYYLP
jgi:hypothetical protein